MNYRNFGNTEEKVSILGFGGGRLPEKEINGTMHPCQDEIDEMVKLAYEKGVNYFDTAPLYLSCRCEEAIGHAVRGFREKVKIAGKIQGEDSQKNAYFQALEKSLKNLGTDYIDYYHFWGIGKGFFDEVIVKNGLLGQAYRAKEQGLIRHVSFSFHGMPQEMQYIIDTAEALGYPFESVLLQYNLLDRTNEQMLQYADEKGLGTTIMGPVGGGRLAVPTTLCQKLTGRTSEATYALALRFVLGNPHVDCALSGVEHSAMVRENIAIAETCTENTADEWRKLGTAVEELKKFSELYCTGCKYCQPCPADIRIHEIFEFYTHYHVYGLTEYARKEYAEYLEKGKKTCEDCMDCGRCEEKCPQKLEVRKHLKRVDHILRGR